MLVEFKLAVTIGGKYQSFLCVITAYVTKGGSDTRIPLLKELFELFPSVPMNIDLKVDSDVMVEKVSSHPSRFSIVVMTKHKSIVAR